jgi:proteasome lid subunit RPN8/RPN11
VVGALSTTAGEGLIIPRMIWEQMRSQVAAHAPEEACGLLAGLEKSVLALIPITNELHSPVRYVMEPHEQLKAFQHMEAQAWELLGIYHSHPMGPDRPSPTDIAEAYYPEAVYLIWSHAEDEWRCRGFRIESQQVRPVELQLTDLE